jgi:4-amino-4-deoxy-L-arabinose transferase-like glycosyltransferase
MTDRLTKRQKITLLGILLVALLLRLIFLLLTPDLEPIYDEKAYLRMAREILADGDFSARWLWPPGQPYFMAGVFSVFGENLVAVKAVQVVLSSLSVYLVFLVTLRVFRSETTGLLAAGITAVYPNLIAFSHYLWSETLFIFLLLCFIHTFLLFFTQHRYRFLIVSGILFSMGCLTRPVLLPCMAITLLYLWHRRRATPRVLATAAMVFAITVVAALTPWVFRNHHVHGGWMVIAPTGHHLWRGNSGILSRNPEEDAFTREKYEAYGMSPLERDRYAFGKAMELIRAGQPFWILKKSALYLRTWRIDRSYVVRHFNLGLYGEISQPIERALVACIRYIYLGMMIGALLGLVWTPYRAGTWFLVGLLVLFSGVYVVSVSRNIRLRLPLEALLIMFSAEGWMLLRESLRRSRRWINLGDDGSGTYLRVPVIRRATLLRTALSCLFIGLFIYNSSANIVAVAQRILP